MMSEFSAWLKGMAKEDLTYERALICFKTIRGSKSWKRLLNMSSDELVELYRKHIPTEPTKVFDVNYARDARFLHKSINGYSLIELYQKATKGIPPSMRTIITSSGSDRENEIYQDLLDKLSSQTDRLPDVYLKDLILDDYVSKLPRYVGQTLEGITSRELKMSILHGFCEN